MGKQEGRGVRGLEENRIFEIFFFLEVTRPTVSVPTPSRLQFRLIFGKIHVSGQWLMVHIIDRKFDIIKIL